VVLGFTGSATSCRATDMLTPTAQTDPEERRPTCELQVIVAP
jgi:hypothetical protein